MDEDLYLEYEAEVVARWNDILAEETIQSNHKILRLHGALSKLKSCGELFLNAYRAAHALVTSSPTDTPGESLRKFKAVFDALTGLVPSQLPAFGEFLACYSVVLGEIAGRLDAISRALYEKEVDLAVVHPGVWPGGWALRNYMVKLMKASEPVPVSSDIISWVKKNRDGLSMATGIDPIEKKAPLGIDWLWPDTVDPERLASWFFDYRKPIKQFVYGDADLR